MAGIKNKPIVKDPIATGYIPVEYNFYKELHRKAQRYDAMMLALRTVNQQINREIYKENKEESDD